MSSLLATQLLVADVYAEFLGLSGAEESSLWKRMLDDELEHVGYLHRLLHAETTRHFPFPKANVARIREVCEQVLNSGSELFLLRLEGALRLECAELDYGLEGLAARRFRKYSFITAYPGDISEHVGFLLDTAERYAESPNIGRQILRLRELLETCLKDTTYITSDTNDRTQ